MLRIGYDAKMLFNNFGGLGTYSRTLIRDLSFYYPDYEYFLYTPFVTKNSRTKVFLNSPLFSVHPARNYERPFWHTFQLPRLVHKHKIDLFHGLSNELPVGLQKAPVKQVVSIHDLIFKKIPEDFSLTHRMRMEARVSQACKDADHIVASSNSTREDIMAFYDVPPERISVIYQSCREQFIQEKSEALRKSTLEKYRLPDKYVLYVGHLHHRKNLVNAIKAIRQLPADIRLPLVIVGEGAVYKRKLLRYLGQQRLQDLVMFIRPKPDDLPALYQGAAVFLYPSLYEGFGIPVLEAMISKTPVITSTTSALPEVAGPAACLIDPLQPDAITEALQKVLTQTEFRKTLIEQSYQHALSFSGESLSEQLVNLYQQLTGDVYINT